MTNKICPRCKVNVLDENEVMNSLSRQDNETYICNDCGDVEAFLDAGLLELTDEQIQIEADFVEWINANQS